jgi:hypothetical protein
MEKKSDFKKSAASPFEYNVEQDKLIKEYQISIEAMAILRKDLAHCVRTETVNQFINCKDLREKYFSLCTDKYKGMIFPAGSEPINREVPGLVKTTRTL